MTNEAGPTEPRRTSASDRVEAVLRQALLQMGIDGGGVAVVTARGHRATVCATDDVAAKVEESQFLLGEGPCVDASSLRSPVLVADLFDPFAGMRQRWPGFLEAVAALGVRALFAFPLRIGAIFLGAMDLYRRTPGDLSAEQLGASLTTADVASLLLLDGVNDAFDLPDTQAGRSGYRLEVYSAAGMVKVQLGITIDEALVRLRAAAFADGRSVNEVARDVVTGRVRFSEEEG